MRRSFNITDRKTRVVFYLAKFISSQLISVSYKDHRFNTFAKHSVFEKNISDLNAFF